MNLTSKYLSSLVHINLPVKLFAVFISYIAPLASVIHVIVLLLVVDAGTSIYYQMKIPLQGRPKANVQREFDVDGSISTTLLYYQYTPTQPSIVGYVQKTGINDRCMEWDYNFTPYAILKELYLASCQGLYAWRRKVYAIYNGHLQLVNLSNLQHNYLLTISGNDSPITCATSTPFGNSHA